MYEVHFNGRTSHVSNYVYCLYATKGQLCDAEHSQLVIAKCLVSVDRNMTTVA